MVLCFSCTFLLLLTLAHCEVVPSLLFSSNMVLVASPTKHAKVFGFAAPSEVVTLTDSSKVHPKSFYTATADATTGAWEIAIEPQPDRSIAPSAQACSMNESKSTVVPECSEDRFPP